MLICRALRTFNPEKYGGGVIRAGERIVVDPQYFAEVNRGPFKLLEEIKPNLERTDNREPPFKQVIPGAPKKKEPEPSPPEPPAQTLPQSEPAELPTDGQEAPSSASRRGRRSRKRT